jgi:undecaprenyl pyrophosphate phosphatase UppP
VEEIDLHGVFVSGLLVWAVVAYVVTALLTRLFARLRLYRLVWHRALFDIAVYVIVWGGVAMGASRLAFRGLGGE